MGNRIHEMGIAYAVCDNYGDKLTQVLFEHYGINTYYSPFPHAHVIGIGSVANYLVSNVKIGGFPVCVFGTGWDGCSGDRAKPVKKTKRVKFFSVRGKSTLKELKKIYPKYDFADVVIGDGGLLATRYIYDEMIGGGDDGLSVNKEYELGIISHYIDEDDERWKKWCSDMGDKTVLISVRLEPHEFVRRVLQCKRIISTAMHPLIAADALGIPNLWCYLPNANQIDMSYKFYDYYSIYNLHKEPYILTNLDRGILELIDKSYDIRTEDVDEIVNKLDISFKKMLGYLNLPARYCIAFYNQCLRYKHGLSVRIKRMMGK